MWQTRGCQGREDEGHSTQRPASNDDSTIWNGVLSKYVVLTCNIKGQPITSLRCPLAIRASDFLICLRACTNCED
jgi:hypothetical protein